MLEAPMEAVFVGGIAGLGLVGRSAVPFCCNAACCACSLDLTISCLASEVFVPGLVRLIFILRPLSTVAECSTANCFAADFPDAPGPPPPVDAMLPAAAAPSFVFSISASKSIIRSPIPMSHSLSSYSKLDDSAFAVVLESATLGRWPPSSELSLIGAAMRSAGPHQHQPLLTRAPRRTCQPRFLLLT